MHSAIKNLTEQDGKCLPLAAQFTAQQTYLGQITDSMMEENPTGMFASIQPPLIERKERIQFLAATIETSIIGHKH